MRAVSIGPFGAAGDGIHDDTSSFAAALRSAAVLHVPAGTYLVDRIIVPAGRTILTDGYATIFRQRAGQREGTRILNIIGSNVRVGDCTLEGNIATDRGEQNHAIIVAATSETGNISNIFLGNVRGRNLRGDLVYVGSQSGHAVQNVRVGNVRGANILRNVVSVVGGRKIAIGRISGSNVGLMHLDIEPDAHNGPVVGCTIGSVTGSFVQVAGATADAYVDQVRIGLLDLAPGSRSVPRYQPGLGREDALTIRNVRSLDIGRLLARGFDGQAIRQVWDPGALTDQNIHVGSAELIDCARRARAAQAYIVGSRRATDLSIDELNIDVPRPGIDVVRGCKRAHIHVVRGRLARGSRLLADNGPMKELLYPLGGVAAMFGAA